MKRKAVSKRGTHCAKCRRTLRRGEPYTVDRGRPLGECCSGRRSVGR